MQEKGKSFKADLLCFSHLRWEFVVQRPQHLMARFARQRRVYFVEEPMFHGESAARLNVRRSGTTGVIIITPVLPAIFAGSDSKNSLTRNKTIARLLRGLIRDEKIEHHVSWFYTPMALEYCPGVQPAVTVYDCMDELSSFKGAPLTLCGNEKELFSRCDLVFAGGVSLFEAKRRQHSHVYSFPSSVDAAHFAQARSLRETFPDQSSLPRPRLGYAGVIDERIDLQLLREIAEQRPEWQFIMVGPVVKIDEATLPCRVNIHWLGKKEYTDLPKYFAGWDVAIMPFAMNTATRYISPTKTPEYLAAGLPVVSTPVRDVVRPYGELGLARIAATSGEFVAAAEQALMRGTCLKGRQRIDAYLQTLSWEDTWKSMERLVDSVIAKKQRHAPEGFMAQSAAQAGAASV